MNKKSLFLGVLLITGLVFITLLFPKEQPVEDKVESSQTALMQNYQTPHSTEVKLPWLRGQEVSLVEAENMLSFAIP